MTTIPEADFYDCRDSDRYTHHTPAEAVEEYLEMFMTLECDTSVMLTEHAPVTITAYRRNTIPMRWLEQQAGNLLEQLAEAYAEAEEWPDPDGSDNGLGKAAELDAQPAMLAAVQKFMAHAKVWSCSKIGEVILNADEVEAMMREHRPDWWEVEP